MRVIFMGTPQFAVPALEKLIESHHDVLAVVTQPDKPAGRGKKLVPPPVKELAVAHGLAVFQPEKLRGTQFHEVLRSFHPDVLVVAAYGKILPPEMLAVARYGCLNIHASLLPKYRGAAPVQWAIINGERKTGVTIMLLDEGLDTGNIVATEEVDILDDDDAVSLSNMLSVVGADLLIKVLDRIEATGRVESTPQDHSQATYAPILKKSDGLLDWTLTTEQIICRILGLQPWPTAFSFLGGKMWKFLRAEPFEDPENLYFAWLTKQDPKYQPLPGYVTATIRGRGFTVKTGDGHLLVTRVQPQAKAVMTGADAVNGKLIKVGDLFISDQDFLLGQRDE